MSHDQPKPASSRAEPPASRPTGREQYAAFLAASSSRVDRFQHDVSGDRRAMLRALVLALVGVGVVTAWKAAADGPAEAGWYLARFGINAAATALVFGALCFVWIEFGGVLSRALLGLVGALAAADLCQHVVNQAVPIMPSVAWVVAIAVFLGVAADLLDLEMVEAAGLTLGVYVVRFVLKFAVYDRLMG